MPVRSIHLIELTGLHVSGLQFKQFLDVTDPLVDLLIYLREIICQTVMVANEGSVQISLHVDLELR